MQNEVVPNLPFGFGHGGRIRRHRFPISRLQRDARPFRSLLFLQRNGSLGLEVPFRARIALQRHLRCVRPSPMDDKTLRSVSLR